MRIKKFKNNQYVLAEDIWTRNPFCDARPIDINSLGRDEIPLFFSNESENSRHPHMQMEEMNDIRMQNVVIASDGFGWEERQKLLGELPNSLVKVIGVNKSLARWQMVGESAPVKRTMTFYVVNNPYPDSASFLPKRHSYYPNLIASTRTWPGFLKNYKGQPYMYRPTPDADYSGSWDVGITLDDYRNPICAAISLAVKRGCEKLLLLCCDEAFEEERPGAERMPNGFYQYAPQIKCQKVIDKQLYWARKSGVKVGDCSSGIEYENAEYISPEKVVAFFGEELDG